MLNFLLNHSPILYLTQSLWRDEAFSILVAEKPISFFFGKLTFEPPFYYILLHFWIKIFGQSEIAARSLSFLAFTLATVIVVIWSEKLFKKHWLSWFTPLIFFFNPMLLYYAFEVRTYGWYIFFATLSMYGYLEKKWRLFVIASVLGFYTHSFFILLPMVCAIHYAVINRKRLSLRPWIITSPLSQSIFSIGLLVTPWLLIILKSFGKLKSSWYFPVDFQLVRSVLGNMFFGYEGTPGYLWNATFGASVVLLFFFFLAMRVKAQRSRNLFFLFAVSIPLVLVIGISFIKPIFVNRYLIFVTIAEVFLLAMAFENIKNTFLQRVAACSVLAVMLGASIWFPPLHKKVDIRKTFAQVNAVKTDRDAIFAKSSLVIFESLYYSQNRKDVFLFNPNESPFPWYVGDALLSQVQTATTIPLYPNRAFLIGEDGSFIVMYQTSVIAKPKPKKL